MNDNQNIHVQNRGRSTSRVLAPPGGHCSISLGVAAPPPPRAREPPKSEEPDVAAAAATEAPAAVAAAAPAPAATAVPRAAAPAPVSANAFAAGSRANGANVMTGRPTSRVLAPPGGHCSITLG